MGVGKGLENGISKQFENDADGAIWIWAGPTTKEYKGLNPGRQIQLHNSDYELSTQKFDKEIDKESSNYALWNANIVYGKETGNYDNQGVTPEHQAIERLTIIKGRFVNANDLINSTKVAVIGEKLRLDLFKDKEAVGEEIAISNIKFKVVGVFMDPGGEREESRVYLPLTTVQKVFVGSDKISNLAFTLHKKDTYEEALAESIKFTNEVSQMLKGKNTVSPDDLSGIGINSTIENVKQFYDLNLYIRLFFWWVGICTIIAGVVGVSNIMMIIVKERTKEIGIRRALGATPAAIRSQILLGAIFLTIIAGMFGIAMATGVVAVINMVLDTMPSEGMMFANSSVDLTVVFIALFILVGSGLLAGYIPAQTAINIKPVDALRTE